MFGIGFSELIVLSVIVLILIGPKQLPEVMRSIAKFTRQITQAQRDIHRTINQDETMRDLRESVDEVKNNVKSETARLKSQLIDETKKDDPS